VDVCMHRFARRNRWCLGLVVASAVIKRSSRRSKPTRIHDRIGSGRPVKKEAERGPSGRHWPQTVDQKMPPGTPCTYYSTVPEGLQSVGPPPKAPLSMSRVTMRGDPAFVQGEDAGVLRFRCRLGRKWMEMGSLGRKDTRDDSSMIPCGLL